MVSPFLLVLILLLSQLGGLIWWYLLWLSLGIVWLIVGGILLRLIVSPSWLLLISGLRCISIFLDVVVWHNLIRFILMSGFLLIVLFLLVVLSSFSIIRMLLINRRWWLISTIHHVLHLCWIILWYHKVICR